jgi:hypothetical protein
MSQPERERSSIDNLIDLFAKDIHEAQMKAHLAREGVEFVIVGGVALNASGSSAEPSAHDALKRRKPCGPWHFGTSSACTGRGWSSWRRWSARTSALGWATRWT